MKQIVAKVSLILTLLLIAGAGAYFIFTEPKIESITTRDFKPARIVSDGTPVILVHGFNQSNQFWKDVNLVASLEAKGFVHMGDFISHEEHEKGCQLKDEKAIEGGKTALYTLSMPSLGTLDIKESAALLAEGIEHATERHRCEKVKLIGFSMGGVVIREYLTSKVDHGVEQVVTVSSPHSGSEHAWVANLYGDIQKRISVNDEESPNGWREVVLNKSEELALDQVKNALDRIAKKAETPVDSEAARMLTPPQDGNYLERLNKKKHPVDVVYHCVITEENILTYHWHELRMDWQKIKKNRLVETNLTAAAVDLLRHSLGKFDSVSDAVHSQRFRGDGVVSCYSQDLNNIAAFKGSEELQATTSKVETSHLAANINSALLELILEKEE